jgi:hypothetical protein
MNAEELQIYNELKAQRINAERLFQYQPSIQESRVYPQDL